MNQLSTFLWKTRCNYSESHFTLRQSDFPLHFGQIRSPVCSDINFFPHLRHLRSFGTIGRSGSGLSFDLSVMSLPGGHFLPVCLRKGGHQSKHSMGSCYNPTTTLTLDGFSAAGTSESKGRVDDFEIVYSQKAKYTVDYSAQAIGGFHHRTPRDLQDDCFFIFLKSSRCWSFTF